MNSAIAQFRNAIHTAGLQPPEAIEPGKIYRFPGAGKRKGNTAGWCLMFNDGLGGCFGDWSTDLSENWQASPQHLHSLSSQATFINRLKQAQDLRIKERSLSQAKASARATTLWKRALPAPANHPYLIRKSIQGYGARMLSGVLVIAIYDSDEIHSLQFIQPNGEKRFLSGSFLFGCYFLIGNVQKGGPLYIAEGFATAASIHEATGHPVAVAFNAGNLLAVAQRMAHQFPELTLVICGDDDFNTKGNPGFTKATVAAKAVNGLLALPEFGINRPLNASDFNDLASLEGLATVRHVLDKAKSVQPHQRIAQSNHFDWPALFPLTAVVLREPYPLDALSEIIRMAVNEVQGFTKAPVSLVASSALGALSVASQCHTDVKRAEGLTGPVGLFLLTVADSGERKSTCDGYFTKSIRDHELVQAKTAIPLMEDYQASLEAWEARRAGTKERIRQLAKNNKPSDEYDLVLRHLERKKPLLPRVPRLLYTDATPEALAFCLAKQWPSGGVISAEAGIVFGGHGMSKDSMMRNLSLLNVLWDGGALAIDRRTSESFTVNGARLTISLQIQEATLRYFVERSGSLARGMGFFARFLFSSPDSTQGYRPFSEPPDQWPSLEMFNQRIAELLGRPAPIRDDGSLNPALLPLSIEAKARWVAFHDQIEKELIAGGGLHDVRDVASKTADNAVRLAALFNIFAGDSTQIGLSELESGCRIAAWHLNEAKCFFSQMAMPAKQMDALMLEKWLVGYCRRHSADMISSRDLQRNVSPVHLRQHPALEIALQCLVESGRVRLLNDNRRKDIQINPALL